MIEQTPSNNTGEQMGFISHLLELRDRLLRMVLAIGVVFIALAPFAKPIFHWFADPLARVLPEGQNLLSIDPAGVFFVPYKLVLLLAFLIVLPYVLYQLWSFIAPGLYRHEKRMVTPLITSSVILFYLGILFAYFVVLPLIFGVLQSFAPDNVDATPDIGRYLDFTMMMFMAFGIGFEMPVATVLLIISGITTREDLARKRPYVVVAAFIVGMFLTPPDVISQVLLAIPMWILFEVGLIASKVFAKQIEVARTMREEREQAERKAEIEAELAAEKERVDREQAKSKSTVQAAATGAATTGVVAGVADSEASDQVDELMDSESYNYDPDDDDGMDHEPDMAWESDTHTFEETGSVQADDEDFAPMTDAEAEAELERMEQEQAQVEADFERRMREQEEQAQQDEQSPAGKTNGAPHDDDDDFKSPEQS